MQLTISRSYFAAGTNGLLYINGAFQCYTIELPWLNNAPQHSCVPEGRYLLLKRWTAERGFHLLLTDVPGRALILMHPANNAIKELRGCIAPVSALVQPGIGIKSKLAVEALFTKVFAAMQTKPVYLTIKKA
ncbi:DUF5675 family protein [Ferruginibacter sp. SUN106]|uniref:DUF5675 family protein n=1 Tax=Ferruginibacter sp. SUN106 TaxID=2978348 RepID=UPI003D3620B0